MLSEGAKNLSNDLRVIQAEVEKAKDSVISMVRNIPLTLRDNGCESTAKELEARLFMLDQQVGRIGEIMKDETNILYFVELMTEK